MCLNPNTGRQGWVWLCVPEPQYWEAGTGMAVFTELQNWEAETGMAVCTCNPNIESRDRHSGTYSSATLARTFTCSERNTTPRQEVGEQYRQTPDTLLWFPHAYTCVLYVPSHTPHTQSKSPKFVSRLILKYVLRLLLWLSFLC